MECCRRCWYREPSIDEMAETWKTSMLYVSGLEPSLTDYELFDAFSPEGRVSSVRICRDLTTGKSLGYGYVAFDHPHDAKRAMEMLNWTVLKGKHIRVMLYVHNPSPRKRGVGNIFIKNLEKSIDPRAFHDTFSCFGSILRCKLATDASGESKGIGIIQYTTEESAQKAIHHLHGMLVNDEQVYVGSFLQRDSSSDEKEMFTDIYVKNLSKSMTDEELNTVFRKYGPTTSCVIIREGEILQGKSRGYGFVNFENPEDAVRAVEALNGNKFEGKEWFVTKSKKTYRRESELKRGLKNAIDQSQGWSYLCFKKLHKDVTDEILNDFLSPYGTVTSCKIMRDSNGVSKGSGFVAFSKPEEASNAMEKINGELRIRKQFYKDLAIELANVTPQQQRTMLGEILYQLVEQIELESASKITGMILEMDQNEVVTLLESHASLHAKVVEAMAILGTVNQHQQDSVSNHLKKVTDQDNYSKSSSLTSKMLDKTPSSSARANKRRRARENKRRTLREKYSLESKVTSVVRTVYEQQYGGMSESANDSKSSPPSPSFINPKSKSLARVNSSMSTHEKSAVLLSNIFDSLEETQ